MTERKNETANELTGRAETEVTETEVAETEDAETENTEKEDAETEVTETEITETENTETEDAETEVAETEVAETEVAGTENRCRYCGKEVPGGQDICHECVRHTVVTAEDGAEDDAEDADDTEDGAFDTDGDTGDADDTEDGAYSKAAEDMLSFKKEVEKYGEYILRRNRKKDLFRRASAFLVLLLMVDAAWVFYLLCAGKNQWLWVCLYWLILTFKNLCDATVNRL